MIDLLLALGEDVVTSPLNDWAPTGVSGLLLALLVWFMRYTLQQMKQERSEDRETMERSLKRIADVHSRELAHEREMHEKTVQATLELFNRLSAEMLLEIRQNRDGIDRLLDEVRRVAS